MIPPKAQNENPQNEQETSPLKPHLDKRVMAYVAAAGAGLLSVAAPAQAEIVYTASNIPMAQGFAGGAITQLDLNNDGTPDFLFSNYSYQTHGLGEFALSVAPAQQGNETVGIKVAGQRRVTAAALPPGVQVGSQANFGSYPKGLNMAIDAFGTSGFRSGSWLKVETAYLGFKFVISGQIHYGWALVKFPSPGGYLSGSIYGYAYETEPNQPIITGQTKGTAEKVKPVSAVSPGAKDIVRQPSGLGMLATGALGLHIWRATGNPAVTAD